MSSVGLHKSSVVEALHQDSQCLGPELVGANEIKDLHDVIEVIAYRSFAQAVKNLGITKDRITEEQSGKILAFVKEQAHVELYRDGGYWKERLNKLNPSQVQGVIRAVAHVIHDRDTKLTDARYSSLSEMLMAFDDHNVEVKNILLKSWYKCPDFSDNDQGHLSYVKGEANFYPAMDAQLKFDLKGALEKRQEFYNTYFPGLRAGVTSESRSTEFVNVLEVRNYFNGNQIEFCIDGPNNYQSLNYTLSKPVFSLFGFKNFPKYIVEGYDLLGTKLIDILDKSYHKDLFEERSVRNLVRRKEVTCLPLLNRDITLEQFLAQYFPEKLPNS